MIDLALHAHHRLDRFLDLVDHAALDVLGELDLADELRQFDAGAQRFPADAAELALVARRRAARRLVELLLALLDRLPGLTHGLDLAHHLPLAVVDLLVGELFVDERHQLADASLVGLERVAHLDDGARYRSASARWT